MSTSLRAQLEDRLPPNRRALLARIGALAAQMHLPVYLAGGVVRDVLLGLTPDDFDMVVEGSAPALARALAAAHGGEVRVHAPFGTATWFLPDGEVVDLASARTETYAAPAALPTVRAPASIADDLRRRDFSINALAVRVDSGEVLDLHGGQADLAARLIRVLHPRSFVDDPTRLFRAARYAGRLGFALAPETAALIPGAWQSLAALSADRLRHEFELIFREANANAILAQLDTLDILRHAHPALHWAGQTIPPLPLADWRMTAPPEPDALYFSLLLMNATPDDVASACERLNLNRATAEAVSTALALEVGWPRPSAAVAVLDGLSELAVIVAYVLRGSAELHRYLCEWRFIHASLTGDDLIARGLAPGPDFKRLLWQLRSARLDGEVRSDAKELELLDKVIG